MLEKLKTLRWWGKAQPPPVVPEPEPAEEKLERITDEHLLAHSVIRFKPVREAIIIEITKKRDDDMKPKRFYTIHWPYLKLKDHLLDTVAFQKMVVAPYRAIEGNHGFRLLRIPLQEGWFFFMGVSTFEGESSEPTEMYVYLNDPDWELVDNVTHQLTPIGSLLVKRVCLATMSTVKEYHVLNGRVYMCLQPPKVSNVYEHLAEVATSILSKK